MKKLSKVEIARRIRDNGYKFKCPYKKVRCVTCRYNDICSRRSLETNMCDIDKKAVDTYIKRYSRKPVINKTVDSPHMDNSETPSDLKLENEPLPEPVKFDDPVPEIVYWLTEDIIIKCKIVEIVHKKYKSGDENIFALIMGGQEPQLNDLYRTLSDAVRIAESKGWK